MGAIDGTLATIFGLEAGRKWIIRDGLAGTSLTGSGAPTASGRKKSFGGRTEGRIRSPARLGETALMARRRGRPPLWVMFFGLFAVAVSQRLLFPPDEHGPAFNVAVFAALGAATLAVLIFLERHRRC